MDGLLSYNFADCGEDYHKKRHICYDNNIVYLSPNGSDDIFIFGKEFKHNVKNLFLEIFNRECFCQNIEGCINEYKKIKSEFWSFANLETVNVPVDNNGEINLKGISVSEICYADKNFYYKADGENIITISDPYETFKFGKDIIHEYNNKICSCNGEDMCIHSYRMFRLRTKNTKLMIKPNCGTLHNNDITCTENYNNKPHISYEFDGIRIEPKYTNIVYAFYEDIFHGIDDENGDCDSCSCNDTAECAKAYQAFLNLGDILEK